MKMTLRALSALLSYPTPELKSHLEEVQTALRTEGVLPVKELNRLDPLLQSLKNENLLTLQARYCELFDYSRALSLHLFEHIHGESRERGQAMIDLGQQYADYGWIMETSELPDFLPVFLEFLSFLPSSEAREWLGQPAHVLAVLEQRLTERNSPYAAVLQVLVMLADPCPTSEAIAKLRDRSHVHKAKSIDTTLDEEWEETPVDFTAPHGPSHVIARIKAAGQVLASAITPPRSAK